MDFDLNAASWRQSITDESALIEALAVRLEDALPNKVIVQREKPLFSKETHVSKIEIGFETNTYILTFHKKHGIKAEKSKTVRGIKLKTENLKFEDWINQFSQELAQYAKENESARSVLEKFLLS